MFKKILGSFGLENKPSSKKSIQQTKDDYSSATTINVPFYIKAPMVLFGLYLFFYFLFLLQDALVPICYALLLSVLLNPVVNKLVRYKIPRTIAISIAILGAIVVFGSILFFLSSQMTSFSEFAPQFKLRLNQIINDAQHFIQLKFNVSFERQAKMFSDALDKSKAYIGETVSTIAGIFGIVVLLPIYVFLILYYKPLIINFFYELFDTDHQKNVYNILIETKMAIQSYISGLLIEMVIVAAMNSVALLALGVEYAILLGVIGAILNVIPYVGGLIAIAMPVVMSLVTGDGGYTTGLYIIIAYLIIQFIDNNVIVPKVVSSKVEVNALISIIIVLLGGSLWGVSGMFLSIPFIAIIKIIFDRIPDLKPWGMLLGTDMNEEFTIQDFGSEEASEKSIIHQKPVDEDENSSKNT